MKGTCGLQNVLAAVALCLVLAGCVAEKRTAATVGGALEREVPQVVAVLPAEMLLAQNATQRGADTEAVRFVCDLTRSVLVNQIAGKGYRPMLTKAVDRKLHGHPDWKTMGDKDLCRLLGAQGIIHVDISDWAMMTVAAIEQYMLTASARMVDATGREVGVWTETADKNKFSIPTSLVGVAATIAGALLGDSPEKQFRHVAYDWGWKMAQVMPDCLEGQTLPEIKLVDSNVDTGTFGIGEKVAVKVYAEKDLVASFDIGDFKRDIPLKMVGDGEYEGYYVVRENDRASGQLLTVRVARLNGTEREWTEAAAPIAIDGIRPKGPVNTTFQGQSDGMHISWRLPTGKEIAAFIIERGDKPVGQFSRIARTGETRFVDTGVKQGTTYFYRVRSEDRARNLSRPQKSVPAVMPRFDEITIGGELGGSLITGRYAVSEDAVVPEGRELTIMEGARLTFAEGVRLTVKGRLLVKGTDKAPVELTGRNWSGLEIAHGGAAQISGTTISGAKTAIRSEGRLRAAELSARGEGGEDGLVLSDGVFELTDVDLSGWKTGARIDGAKGSLARATLTNNGTGVAYISGELALAHDNIHDNARNIIAALKLAVAGNYLGATNVREARVSENVILKSVLDAPYPDGRAIALMAEEDLTAEQAARRFEEHKSQGVALFNARQYGDAYVELRKAAALKADRDTFMYLAYIHMELGEADQAAQTLESAITAFPYDFRLRQIYVRHLLAQGNDAKAMEVVDEALRLAPGNANLLFLKECVEKESKRLHSELDGKPQAPPTAP